MIIIFNQNINFLFVQKGNKNTKNIHEEFTKNSTKTCRESFFRFQQAMTLKRHFIETFRPSRSEKSTLKV